MRSSLNEQKALISWLKMANALLPLCQNPEIFVLTIQAQRARFFAQTLRLPLWMAARLDMGYADEIAMEIKRPHTGSQI
jgi:hypothetical protein